MNFILRQRLLGFKKGSVSDQDPDGSEVFADPDPELKIRIRLYFALIYSKSNNKYSKIKYRIFTMNILCLIFLAHILRRSK